MNSAAAFLIVGLGNPGPEYARTRHNMGFMVVDELARRANFSVDTKSRLAFTGKGTISNRDVILAKPRTFMNLSGQAVVSLRAKHSIAQENLIVISDDFCLPLGRLRVRPNGGNGGHNGLANIIECLGSKEFARLRLGIGPAPVGRDPIDFVLGKFHPDEFLAVNELVSTAADAVAFLLEHGLEPTMNKFNAT